MSYFYDLSCIENVTDEDLEEELSSSRGKHAKVVSLLEDRGFHLSAQQFMREHGYVKGKPNLTLSQFTAWVKEECGVEVCEETARRWLHEMGFTYRQFPKGVYFDGHEREDVVEDRKAYLNTLYTLSVRILTRTTPALDPSSPLIRVFHDESTFHSNADQTFHGSDGTKQALKQKSLMVSD